MKDFKERPESLRKRKSRDAAVKDRRNSSSVLRNLGAEVEPPATGHATLVGDESASLPANAKLLAQMVEQLQQTYGNTYVQRLVSGVTDSKSGLAMSEAGQRMDAETQVAMEAAFGEDFGDVRIHDGLQAQEATEELGARAFTRGKDIYFGTGEYDPLTNAGKKILAHELTHVIQQREGSVTQPSKSIGRANDSFEQEADRAEAEALSGQRPRIVNRTHAPALQCKEKREEPMVSRHRKEITPTPTSGVIDAAGRFSVAYSYTIAELVVLTLHVPGGVMVGVIPLTDMSAGDYRINDPGGTAARTVTLSVSSRARMLPKIQVTLTQGSFTYIVIFQFVQSSEQTEPEEPGTP